VRRVARGPEEGPAGDPAALAVRIARGARATEAALLAEIDEFASEVRAGPALLARPLRVVVPSRSLREHLAARLMRRRGRSLAGVSIQTLRGLAFELLRGAGEPSRGGDLLFPILVRQAARREPALRAALDSLDDGYGVVTASVSDLLDAGFEAAHAEAIDEWLEAHLGGAAAARGRAVLRVAAAVLAALDAAGLEHRSGLFRRAREVLESDPWGALPSHRILVHGYADATGVQLELIAALVRYGRARVLVDHPDDPSEPGRPDPGTAFTTRLLGRLEHLAAIAPLAAPPPAPAELELFRAPGLQAEVRSVAERVTALLEAGALPEEIGVVVRDLSPFAVPLRTHFERLGIPFSGPAAACGPLEPEGRRLRALLDLLSAREMLSADRWLDASDWMEPRERRDLQLAFHAVGVARLREAASLDLEELLGGRDSYALPLRGGLEDEEESEAPAASSRRRRVSRRLLATAVRRARSLERRLSRWARTGSLADHIRALRELLRRDLDWGTGTPGFDLLTRLLGELGREVGSGVNLDLDEFVLLCQRALRDLGRSRLGGEGGGVQVLRVVDARGRTFEHLFVMGLNRDLFPRGISEDPLLPDAIRAALERDVLPDIPIKRRGFDEERYLFAGLLSASPRVTLSWQAVSDDGKQRTPSPLVERLRLANPAAPIPLVPGLFGRSALAPLRPAHEHAVLAGLSGKRERFEEILPLALEEVRRSVSLPCDAATLADLARGRLSVLAELDRAAERRSDLGPYFGFLGPIAERGDPRSLEPYVTVIESLARCPWQTFLGRLLHLEPLPDARGALPEIDPSLIGNLLHRVLERIASDAGVEVGGTLPVEGEGLSVPWPDPEQLGAILGSLASTVVREAGIGLRGFPRVLAARTRPYLERVRAIDFAGGDLLPAVLGVETEGRVSIPAEDGQSRVLRFRADRIDRFEAGLRLTDYKAGKPISGAKTPETRRAKLLEEIAAGRRLQGAAYAFGAGSAADRSHQAVGRYLFASPDLEDGPAVEEVDSGDAEARERFEAALRILFAVWEQGSFFPRLVDAKSRSEPDQCERCEFSEACLRGDSGARARLLRWLERASAPGARPPLGGAEAALLAAFGIAEAPR
jgi:RecB family exonuclease